MYYRNITDIITDQNVEIEAGSLWKLDEETFIMTLVDDDQHITAKHVKEIFEEDLPPLNKIVLAKCQRIDGSIEEFKIRRIASKDYEKGWQWSNDEIKTYFTLKVLSWRYLS